MMYLLLLSHIDSCLSLECKKKKKKQCVCQTTANKNLMTYHRGNGEMFISVASQREVKVKCAVHQQHPSGNKDFSVVIKVISRLICGVS